MKQFFNDSQIVCAQGAAGFGNFYNGVSEFRGFDLCCAPRELDHSCNASVGQKSCGQSDNFGCDSFSLQVSDCFDGRILRDTEHPSDGASADF